MRRSVVRRLQPVLDAQLGVVTSAQLRELRIDLEVPRREGWLRLADGMWVAAAEPADEQLLVVLQKYAPEGLASGALACRWLGVRHASTTPGGRALVPHGTTLLGGPLLRLHQTRRMPAGVEHAGYEVAPALRAVADAARWAASLQDARAVVLAALADRVVTEQDLLDECAAGPRRTAGRLRRPLDDWARGARSAPEAEAADAVLAAPGPWPALGFLLNPEIRLHGELIGSPDGYIPAAGTGWEMDSREFHEADDALDATLLRHQRFDDADLSLLHVTPKRFRSARSVWAHDLRRRAWARVSEGWRAPDGLEVIPRGPLLGVSGGVAAAG